MTPEKWNKIKSLFSVIQDRPDNERVQLIKDACGDDEEMKREVAKLFASYLKDDDLSQDRSSEQFASLFGGESTALIESWEPDEAASRFEVGAVIKDRYEIVKLLGRGGMGEVYLAKDRRIIRNVAIKVLHSDLVANKESLRRFELEAQTASALNHPNMMTIHEFDNDVDGAFFFVAEYVEGQTLNHLVGKELGLVNALDIAIQVSSALSAAHEAGITHRDIKPENIIVRRDGYIKVLDFGLAKLTQQPLDSNLPVSKGSEEATRALHRTKPGVVMGTPSYMSPEQARGIEVDARTDIWSIGVVIYEMVTGLRPFPGDTSADILVSVLLREPPPIGQYVADLPRGLESIVFKALSKDIDRRYQTTSELRSDLIKLKKRIEIDESLGSPERGRSLGISLEESELTQRTLEHVVPTSDGGGKPTNDGQGDTNREPSVASTSGISTALKPARLSLLRSLTIVFVLIVLLSLGGYYAFVDRDRRPGKVSIAVLPFENTSGSAELAYLADGMSETIIDRLSEQNDLKVISRNSSFKFRGPGLDLRAIASQLGVQTILTGSIVQIGDEIAIRYDLVEASNDRQIAGGQIKQRANDISRVPIRIAREACTELGLKLTDTQSARLAEPGTKNSEAFRYYLSGLVELNSGPTDIQAKALDYFEQAVALDPNFAAAYAEIGWIYWYRANGNENPRDLMPKAKTAAERAIAIDPDLAKAHIILASVREYEFDWIGAETEYLKAIELSPNLDDAHNSYALFLSVMGRQEESLAELDKQGMLDPINRRMTLQWKGAILAGARKFDESLQTYQEAISLEPDKEIPPIAYGYAYAGMGAYREAAVYYKQAADQFGGEEKYSQPLVYLAATYAKIPERQGEARSILKKIEAMPGYRSPALTAAVYSALNENDKAMELLDKAYLERDLLLRYVGTAYEYDGLRRDPRFTELINGIGVGK